MLKTVQNGVFVKGSSLELMADLTMIIRAVVEAGALDYEDVKECVKASKLSEEEMKAESEKLMKENEELFEDILKMLMKK